MSNIQNETTENNIIDANYELTQSVVGYASEIIHNDKATMEQKSNFLELAINFLSTDIQSIEEYRMAANISYLSSGDYDQDHLIFWQNETEKEKASEEASITALMGFYYGAKLSHDKQAQQIAERMASDKIIQKIDASLEKNETVGTDTNLKFAAIGKIYLLDYAEAMGSIEKSILIDCIMLNSTAHITEENVRPRDENFYGSAHFKLNMGVFVPEPGEQATRFEDHPVMALIEENKKTAKLQGIDAGQVAIGMGTRYFGIKSIATALGMK